MRIGRYRYTITITPSGNNKPKDKKTIIVYSIAFVVLVILFILSLTLNDVPDEVNGRNSYYAFGYGVILALAVIATAVYCFTFKVKSYGAIGLCISACIECVGCLVLSLSADVSEALLASKIAYLGNCFFPLTLFVVTLETCRVKYNKKSFYALIGVSIAAFVLTLTIGYSDAFYKNVDFANDGGIVTLSTEYGPSYIVYQVYVGVYYALSVACIIHTAIKNYIFPKKNVFTAAEIIALNIFGWILGILLNAEIELNAVAAAASIYFMMTSFERLSDVESFLIKREECDNAIYFKEYVPEKKLRTPIPIVNYSVIDEFGDYNLLSDYEVYFDNNTVVEQVAYLPEINFSKYSDEQSREFLTYLDGWKSLSKTEKTIAVYLLKDIKRADIAAALDRMEDTIKTHTSHIYKKLSIKNREELCSAVIKKMRERKII